MSKRIMSIFTQAAPLESLFDSYEPCLALVVLVVAIYKHAVFFIFSFLKFTFFSLGWNTWGRYKNGSGEDSFMIGCCTNQLPFIDRFQVFCYEKYYLAGRWRLVDISVRIWDVRRGAVDSPVSRGRDWKRWYFTGISVPFFFHSFPFRCATHLMDGYWCEGFKWIVIIAFHDRPTSLSSDAVQLTALVGIIAIMSHSVLLRVHYPYEVLSTWFSTQFGDFHSCFVVSSCI